MAEKFPTPQERAMAWLLEATEIGGMSRPAPDRNRIWYMSGKDRANNRSKTPLGFARAVYEVNQGKATEE